MLNVISRAKDCISFLLKAFTAACQARLKATQYCSVRLLQLAVRDYKDVRAIKIMRS